MVLLSSGRLLSSGSLGVELLSSGRLGVELLGKIRDERRFASVGELRAQIARDRETVLAQIAGERE